jgi:hypothetical protein
MNQGEALLAPPALPTERIAHLGGRRLLRCGISIRPMTAVGQSRQIDTAPGSRHVRFAPQSGHRELVSTADEIIRFT